MTPSTDSGKLEHVIQRIDAVNSEDPNLETAADGPRPKELLYGQRMSAWLDRLAPDAPDTLRIAARGQHIRRWTIPRDEYPEGKQGYHAWRKALAAFHAETLGAIMADAGYGQEQIARTQALVRKENLRADPETQLLEDVICLVFLQYYFADFAGKHPEQKLITILRKTWRKMSPLGHETAKTLLPALSAEHRALVEKALG